MKTIKTYKEVEVEGKAYIEETVVRLIPKARFEREQARIAAKQERKAAEIASINDQLK